MVTAARPPLRFRYWTRDELIGFVRGIEEAMATGAASVGYSAAGTVAYVKRENMTATLADLYARIDQIDGIRPDPLVRRVRVFTAKGL